MAKQEENILYGGPDPPMVDETAKSLGECILNKLTEYQERVLFVSILALVWGSFLCVRVQNLIVCCFENFSD